MNPQNIQNMQNIPYPDNIICLYSKFSRNCKRFSSVAGPKIPIIKFVCIDNEKVRQKVLANLSIQVQVVPCILLTYSNGVIEKFDGENAFRWAAGIIQKMERPQVQEQFQAQPQAQPQPQPQEQMQLQAQPQPQEQAQLQPQSQLQAQPQEQVQPQIPIQQNPVQKSQPIQQQVPTSQQQSIPQIPIGSQSLNEQPTQNGIPPVTNNRYGTAIEDLKDDDGDLEYIERRDVPDMINKSVTKDSGILMRAQQLASVRETDESNRPKPDGLPRLPS